MILRFFTNKCTGGLLFVLLQAHILKSTDTTVSLHMVTSVPFIEPKYEKQKRGPLIALVFLRTLREPSPPKTRSLTHTHVRPRSGSTLLSRCTTGSLRHIPPRPRLNGTVSLERSLLRKLVNFSNEVLRVLLVPKYK